MRRWAVVLSALSVSLGAATVVTGTANGGNDNDPYTVSNGHAQAGPKGGIVPAQDSNAARPGGGGGKNLLYHGGIVRSTTTSVQPIYWGTTWNSGDPKISALASLYAGLTASNPYALTNAEYYDTVGGGTHSVNPGVSLAATPRFDSSQAVTGDPTTQQIVDEVVHVMGTQLSDGAYYPVYVDSTRGSVGYCAWHSYGSSGGKTFQVGFFFNLDNDAGCNPNDSASGHPEGIAALGNVTGHEYSEMVTDPQSGGWWDQQGAENADKCAWTFGSSLLQVGADNWKIQGNWSNKAYAAGVGYGTGRKKVVGCVDGTNASAP